MNRLLLIALFGFALGGGVNAQVNELGLTIGGT
jgi:hypothetical protein